MELHQALKHIIKAEGQDIITDLRLVNILNDLNAYQDIPASKYILRAIIADGYTSKLLRIGKWNNLTKVLANRFSTTTGFKEESVENIFQSLAFGLGWLSTYTPFTSKSSTTSPSFNPPTSVLISNTDFAKMTHSDQEKYLSGLIDIDTNIKSQLGIEIRANVVIKAPTLYLNLEANGKLKQKYDISVFAAIYNRDNEVKGLRKVMIFNNKPILSSLCCSSVFFDGFLFNKNYSDICNEYNISKIVIYAERDLY